MITKVLSTNLMVVEFILRADIDNFADAALAVGIALSNYNVAFLHFFPLFYFFMLAQDRAKPARDDSNQHRAWLSPIYPLPSSAPSN